MNYTHTHTYIYIYILIFTLEQPLVSPSILPWARCCVN